MLSILKSGHPRAGWQRKTRVVRAAKILAACGLTLYRGVDEYLVIGRGLRIRCAGIAAVEKLIEGEDD